MFKSILLAYDGSDCANHGAEIARELAGKFDSLVLVVYAFHPIPRHWGDDLAEKAVAEEMTRGQILLGGVLERLKQSGVRVESHIVEGMAHEAITKMARAHNVDLIIIGSLGMGERTSYLMGTVSDKVVHRATCPVLVVR